MEKLSLGKEKIKCLLLEGVHLSAIECLHAAGYTNIEYHKGALEGEELKEAIKEANFIGVRSRTQLTQHVLLHAKKLKAIGCFCIGTNQVDLNAATLLGIPVFNAPYSNTRSVAELVLGELICLFRNIPKLNARLHNGVWQKSAADSFEVRGKSLGIVGYGHIGVQLGVLAESIGMKVYFYDIVKKLSVGNAVQIDSLESLLKRCDAISLHVPQNETTKNLMGKQQFEQMKEGSILINAARGNVIDIPALIDALSQKKIKSAAIDVFPEEPSSNQERFLSELCEFDQVILTPHIGGSTEEAQENIGIEVIEKFIHYSDNGTTVSAVNFPEVSLPNPREGIFRVMHIHKNLPGVLTKINQLLTDSGVNIAAQYLQTNDKIGYVVVDIEGFSEKSVQNLLEQLKEIPNTIWARILY